MVPRLVGALELARRERRAAGHADPVGQYVDLQDAWPGDVVVHDPRAGEIRGHRQLRRFVWRSHSVVAEHRARVEPLTSTAAGDRAVVELLAHLTLDGRQLA